MLCVSSACHGSGRTTVARAVARVLGWKYVSAGEIMRRMAREEGYADVAAFVEHMLHDPEACVRYNVLLDEAVASEADRETVVDSNVAPYYLKCKRVLVVAPLRTIQRRVYAARREGDPEYRSEWDAGRKLVARTVRDIEMYEWLGSAVSGRWGRIYKRAARGMRRNFEYWIGLRRRPDTGYFVVENTGSVDGSVRRLLRYLFK